MKYTLFLILLCISQTIAAQHKIATCLRVLDNFTEECLDSVGFKVIWNDSLTVESRVTSNNYILEFDYRPGKYTIIVKKDGYDTEQMSFNISTWRNRFIMLDDLRMRKMREMSLDEVTVRGTLIKMVHKGDTVVYNADAFNLAEGSMLNDLVKQLPGAEINDGEIRVNGQLIESLLVNGEDFFSGNPQIALQNLPAYTVKNIKVYDRADRDEYLKDKRKILSMGREHITMDVTLKKIYSKGIISNLEAAYGLPDDRYMARGFGIGHYGKSRLALFFNANNIRNTQMGKADGNWNSGWAQAGRMNLIMGGLDYLAVKGKYKWLGDLTLTEEKPVVNEKTSSVSFYDAGDIYGRRMDEYRDTKRHLMSKHSMQYSGDNVYVEVTPQIDYMHNSYSRLTNSVEMTAAPEEEYRMQALDSLFAPSWQSSRYRSIMQNRLGRNKLGVYDRMILQADAKSTIKIKGTPDNVELSAGWKYNHYDDEQRVAYNRVVNSKGDGEDILQHSNYINRNREVYATAEYQRYYWPYKIKEMTYWVIVPKIEYRRSHISGPEILRQNSWTFTDGATAGLLPPSSISPEMLDIDMNNSHDSRHITDRYKPGVEIYLGHIPDAQSIKDQYQFMLAMEDNMSNERMQYSKAGMDTTVTRFRHSISPKLKMEYKYETEIWYKNMTLDYKYYTGLPSIYERLNIINDHDPVNIYVKNPNLHNSRTHETNILLNIFHKKTESRFAILMGYKQTDDAIAKAKYYDRATGTNTWRAENVDGNWNAYTHIYSTISFGRGNMFLASANTFGDFVHSVDYATDTEKLALSKVDNLTLTEKLSLTCKLGKHSVGVQGGLTWHNSRSKREGFEGFDAININGGVDATLNLPHNWQIATDMNVLARTGYTDSNLNTTTCVWNASLSKTMLKGNLVLKVNAVDILNQLSDVQHTVNAQGQTETWRNSLPNYVMLHTIYRLNFTPKKK
ncbi:MAG: hypothetical protein Q4E63_07960 [Prevotellaceae bacterium]|nr:hypothetical protein [Prevotellaceae bacterium]